MNEIFLGDAHVLLKDIPAASVDAIITDPPYGVLQQITVAWDDIELDWELLFAGFNRALKQNSVLFLFGCVSFYCRLYPYFSPFFRIHFDLVWVKPNSINFIQCNKKPLNQHELILCLLKHSARVSETTYNPRAIGHYRTPWCRGTGNRDTARIGSRIKKCPVVENHDGFRYPKTVWECYSRGTMPIEERTIHPTQKPLPLLERLVLGFTNEGDLILDPFCGSGSTCVAAMKHKRNFVGMDISEEYVGVARSRIHHESLQLKLF